MNDGRWDWDGNDEAKPEEVDNALRRVLHDGARRRNTRRSAIGGGLAILLVAAVGTGALIGTKKSSSHDQTVLASRSEAPVVVATTTAPAGTPSSTAPTDPTASRPKELIVTENDNAGNGKLVVLDGRTAKRIRILYSGNTRLGGLSLSPNGDIAYFMNYNTQLDGGSLWKVPVAGGTAAQVKDFDYTYLGYVSPDGKHLASGTYQGGPGCGITVTDLASNSFTPVAKSPENPGAFCGGDDVAWVDNDHIITSVAAYTGDGYQQLNDKVSGLYILDIHKGEQPVTGGVKVKTPASKPGTELGSPAVLPDGSIYAIESCCDLKGRGLAPNSTTRMVILDPTTGAVKRVVATGFPDRIYTNTAADKTGNHLIYMSNDDVRVSDFGGNPVVLARGITAAAWR